MDLAIPRAHIIIGEDNPADSRLISLCLEDWNTRFDISCFPSGRKLRNYLEHHLPGAEPTVIFLDFFLAEIEGPRMMQWIRQSPAWKEIPVVLMSGSYLEDVRERSFEFGGNFFLEKSTDPEKFFEEISGIVRFLLRHNPSIASQ